MAGDCTTRNYLQTIDYAYNTRGWLTDINDFSAGDLFSFKLHYNVDLQEKSGQKIKG